MVHQKSFVTLSATQLLLIIPVPPCLLLTAGPRGRCVLSRCAFFRRHLIGLLRRLIIPLCLLSQPYGHKVISSGPQGGVSLKVRHLQITGTCLPFGLRFITLGRCRLGSCIHPPRRLCPQSLQSARHHSCSPSRLALCGASTKIAAALSRCALMSID